MESNVVKRPMTHCPHCRKPLDMRNADIAAILDHVGRAYGTDATAILSPLRTANVAHARHVAMYLAIAVFAINRDSLARYMGRDRSISYYAVKRVEAEQLRDPTARLLIRGIAAEIRADLEQNK